MAATKIKGSRQSRAKIVRDQTDGKEKEVFGFKFPTAKRLTIMLQRRLKKFRFKSPDHMRDWTGPFPIAPEGHYNVTGPAVTKTRQV